MSKYFSDEELFYFGHGTVGDDFVVHSIFDIGLKVADPKDAKGYFSHLRGLESTSISFGSGSSHLLSQQQNLLDNWSHNEANKVVIIALPSQFVLSYTSSSPNADLYKAFYIGSKGKGYRIRPELIRGYYDADSKSFTPNENFFQNLDEDKKKAFMDDLASCYIDNYANHSFRSPIDDLDFPRDLVDEKKAAIQWYKVQLERLKKYEELEKEEASYDYSHDFDDVFYGSASEVQAKIAEGWEGYEDDFDILTEEEWANLLSNPTISDFNSMMHDIKTRKAKDNKKGDGIHEK